MIGITHRGVTAASVIKSNNAAICREYNRSIDWDYRGDADEPLRDRPALFRPCIIVHAVPVQGVDGAGEFHHRCCVMFPVEDDGFVTAYLDVSDADYRTAIAHDVIHKLEMELPVFFSASMTDNLPLAKQKMLADCYALFDEYGALDGERE